MGKFINGSVPTRVVNQLPSSALFYGSVLLTSSTVDDSHGSLRLVVADFIAASLRPDSSTKFSPAMSSWIDTVRSQQGLLYRSGCAAPLILALHPDYLITPFNEPGESRDVETPSGDHREMSETDAKPVRLPQNNTPNRIVNVR